MLNLFLIKHKPTGHYLAEPHGRSGRGGSHVEPGPGPNNARICRSMGSAKAVLGAWLRGKFVASRGMSQSGPDWDSEFYEEITIIPVPERKREDMEIVPIEVQLP